MRIQPNAPDPRELTTERASTSSVAADSARQTRRVHAPADRVSLKSLTTRTMEVPDIRQEKVARLKQMIASGQYQVNAKEVADAILHG